MSRKRKVRVRVACTGDAGATCSGTLKLERRGKSLGSKRFTLAAGATAKVVVKLKKSAFKKVKRKRHGLKANLILSGTDSSGAQFGSSKSVRLLRPRRRG